MFPTAPAPTIFLITVILAVAVVSSVGFSAIWVIFAVTLVVTTIVAIHRSIPRKER